MKRWFTGLVCVVSWSLQACNETDQATTDAADATVASDAGTHAPDPSEAGAPGALCDPRAPRCAADEKCATTHWDLAAAWPAPRCTPNPGAAGLNEDDACFSAVGVYDYCGSGLACTNYGTGEGFCRGLCQKAGADCGKPGSVCATVDPDSGFMLCLPRCDVDADCGLIGFFSCVERDAVKFCDTARAMP